MNPISRSLKLCLVDGTIALAAGWCGSTRNWEKLDATEVVCYALGSKKFEVMLGQRHWRHYGFNIQKEVLSGWLGTKNVSCPHVLARFHVLPLRSA